MPPSAGPVGRWGLALLAVTGATGFVLAIHGWSVRGSSGLPAGSVAVGSQLAPRSNGPQGHGSHGQGSHGHGSHSRGPRNRAPRTAGPSRPSPSASASAGPLLSSEPYASAAYQVWPGRPSAAARLALTGLKVSVRVRGTGLLVTAGAVGQPPGSPQLYPAGARVYIVESSLGDDSGNTDYNLGDDGLVVTSGDGRIVP